MTAVLSGSCLETASRIGRRGSEESDLGAAIERGKRDDVAMGRRVVEERRRDRRTDMMIRRRLEHV